MFQWTVSSNLIFCTSSSEWQNIWRLYLQITIISNPRPTLALKMDEKIAYSQCITSPKIVPINQSPLLTLFYLMPRRKLCCFWIHAMICELCKLVYRECGLAVGTYSTWPGVYTSHTCSITDWFYDNLC